MLCVLEVVSIFKKRVDLCKCPRLFSKTIFKQGQDFWDTKNITDNFGLEPWHTWTSPSTWWMSSLHSSTTMATESFQTSEILIGKIWNFSIFFLMFRGFVQKKAVTNHGGFLI